MNTQVKPKAVIIDSDIGWDDIVAISLMLKNPNFNVLGITVTGCGETHLDKGVQIARTLVELGQSNAVVCRGAEKPSCYDNQFPPSFRAQMDSVFGLLDTLKKPVRPADPRPAWDFIADCLATTSEPISILSLGGFTNIAKLLDVRPDANLGMIDDIVIMGGAVDCEGNVADLNNAAPQFDQGPVYGTNTVAEWNIFLDAKAAKRVFHTSIPLTLVPLDACNHVMLSKAYAGYVTATDPLAKLVHEVLKLKATKGGPYYEPKPVPVFDPLAAIALADTAEPEDRKVISNGDFDIIALDVVDLQPELPYGCRPTPKPPYDCDTHNECGKLFRVQDPVYRPFKVAMSADPEKFERAFKHWINAPLPQV